MPTAEKKIMLVDDDEDIREAVSDTLTDEGFAVVALPDGAAGLNWLRTQPAPALVLLDWNMTPINGLQFMREVAKEPGWASIPIVLLTADGKAEEKVKLAPFAGYLAKPVNLDQLFEVIRRYCG